MQRIMRNIISLLLIVAMLGSCSNTIQNGAADNQKEINDSQYLTTDVDDISDKDIIKVQIGHNPENLDPATNSMYECISILEHLFEGLLKYGQDGELSLGIAESYKVSSDGLTWSFKLRDNLKWSDGSTLDANDLVYTWKRVVDPTTSAPYAYDLLKQVVGYEEASKGNVDALSVVARDDKTFVVNLESPCAYFDKICAFSILSPVKKSIVSTNGNWSESAKTYISNGPYYVSNFTRDSVILKKNKYYYDSENITFKEIEYYHDDNEEKTLEMYENGNLQLIKDIPTRTIDEMKNRDDFYINNMIGTYYILINLKKSPFDNIKVRKALSLAIDRNYIANTVMHGTYKVARNFVGPGISDYGDMGFEEKTEEMYNGPFFDNDNYENNFEEAKRLLKEAGYENGINFPEVRYIVNDEGYNIDVAEQVKLYWSRLGINVKLELYSNSVFSKMRRSGDFDVARSGWMCDWDDPSNIISVFETFSGHNYGKYSSSKFDQLVKEARETTVVEDHYYKLHLAERVFLEDYAIIPLSYYETYWLQKQNLKNVRYSPYGILYFMNAYFE